jgi:hypothetical protein
MLKIERMTEESNKKKRAVENEIMDTTSLQVKQFYVYYIIDLRFLCCDRLNLIKQQVIFDVLIFNDKNFLNDGKRLLNKCKIIKCKQYCEI